jgi:hypothetical protein
MKGATKVKEIIQREFFAMKYRTFQEIFRLNLLVAFPNCLRATTGTIYLNGKRDFATNSIAYFKLGSYTCAQIQVAVWNEVYQCVQQRSTLSVMHF